MPPGDIVLKNLFRNHPPSAQTKYYLWSEWRCSPSDAIIMQLVWCNRRLHREKHLLSDHRSTSSVWGSQHHSCSCFQRATRQSLVTPCLLAQPLGNFTLHTKARESTDQTASPQKTMAFAFLITGDWLINCMNSTVLPLWRDWWHSDSLPGKRWEAHDYPQQTGCKQWLSPCGKSNG